jgi:ribosomal protein S18 acetylase RimI-like enzyme
MTQEEFVLYAPFLIEGYAAERARNFNTPIDQERETATRQIAGLLPDGVNTLGHKLWFVVDDGNEVVGNLWVNVSEERASAFIFDIEIREEHRGKGYARQALALLEDTLRMLGIRRLGLNVFDDNTVAQHLYRRQGFRPGSDMWEKEL